MVAVVVEAGPGLEALHRSGSWLPPWRHPVGNGIGYGNGNGYGYGYGGARAIPIEAGRGSSSGSSSGSSIRRSCEADDFVGESDRFIRRASLFMASNGIRQFLRIGGGLTHGADVRHTVRQLRPARMLYVDSNPMVLALARVRAGSDGDRGGRIAYEQGDLTDPEAMQALLRLGTLDLTKPVGVLLGSVLHLIPDREDPYRAVRRLVEALAPGSYLAVAHFTPDHLSPGLTRALRIYQRSGVTAQLRTRAEVARFFTGLHLVAPGIEIASRWRRGPDDGPPPPPDRVACLAGVARIPGPCAPAPDG
jgi:hypothetical protein